MPLLRQSALAFTIDQCRPNICTFCIPFVTSYCYIPPHPACPTIICICKLVCGEKLQHTLTIKTRLSSSDWFPGSHCQHSHSHMYNTHCSWVSIPPLPLLFALEHGKLLLCVCICTLLVFSHSLMINVVLYSLDSTVVEDR